MSGSWGTAQKWYSYTRKTQAYVSWSVSSSSDESVTFSVTGCARSGDGSGQYYASGYTVNVEIWYRVTGGGWVSLGSTSDTLNYGNSVASITKSLTINRTASAQTVEFWTDASSPSGYWPTATSSMSTTVDAHPTYAPSAPSNVTAAFSGNKIVVKWRNNASTWAAYSSIELQVQKSGGVWSNVSTSISGSSTSYSYPASGSVDSTAYYSFRVRAKNSKGNSSYATSSVLWGTPSAPSSVTISKLSSTSVLVSASGSWSTGAVIDASITVNGASGYSNVSSSGVPTQGAFSYTFSGLPAGATVRAFVRQRFATPGNASPWVSSEEIKLALPPSGATEISSDGYLIDKTANVKIWFDDDSEEAPRSEWVFSLFYVDAQSQYGGASIGEVVLPTSEVTSGADLQLEFPFLFQDAGRSFIVRVAARGDGGMSGYMSTVILRGPLPTSGVSADISCGWSSELGYHVNVTVSAPFDNSYKPRMIVAARQSSGLSAIVKDTESAGAAFANGLFSYVNSYVEEEKIVWADAGAAYHITFKYGSRLSQSFELTLDSQIRQAWHVPSVSFGPQKTVNGVWMMPVLFDAAKIDDVERASRYEISFEPSGYGLTPEFVDDVGKQSYEFDKPFSIPGHLVNATVVATGGDGWFSGMPVTTSVPYEFFSTGLRPPAISNANINQNGSAEVFVSPVASNGQPFLATIDDEAFVGYEYLLYVDDEPAENFEICQSSGSQIAPVIDGNKVYFSNEVAYEQRCFSFCLDMKSPWRKSLYLIVIDDDGASVRSNFISVAYVPANVGIYVASSDVAISDCLVSEFPTALRLSKSAVEVSSSDLSYNGQKYTMDDRDSIISEFGVR